MSSSASWVSFESLGENGGRFLVTPLRKGMGTTLGNSLRRVLLSSLPGAAISRVRIKGVQHEFSAIPNVVEDVLDVLANLKGVVLKYDGTEPVTLRLKLASSGVVTAGMLEGSSEVSVLNKDHLIATVSDGGKFELEVQVETGIGYRGSNAAGAGDIAIDTILLDCSFSPISRVNHRIDAIRVGDELDHECLEMEVWSNGSISVEQAVQRASEILVDGYGLFSRLNEKPSGKGELVAAAETKKVGAAMNLTIEDLQLSARSSNCLKKAGIKTVGELVDVEIEVLRQIKNFGEKSASEINGKLAEYSLSLRGFTEELL